MSEFSPRWCEKYLSYITGPLALSFLGDDIWLTVSTGWLCFTGWQAAIVGIAYLNGTIIQGLIILNHGDTYEPQRWHGTMLVIAIAAFSILFNTSLAKKLPLVEAMVLILHVVGVFAIIIPLWVLAPRNNARDVFTRFENNGGWPSTGFSFMVGIVSVAVSLLGFDCGVHMCR